MTEVHRARLSYPCPVPGLCLTQREFAGPIFGRVWLQEGNMDTATLLIIVVALLVLGGGVWYGKGRWF